MTSEVLDYIPKALLDITSQSDVIAPNFAELDELAKVDEIDKRVAVVKDEHGTLLACAVCFVESRRHHGLQLKVYSLFGYLLHDYGRIFCISTEAMKLLKATVVKDARKQRCDIVIWSNIPAELVPEKTLPLHTEIKIFDATKSEQGWSRFYKSKHVKYSLSRAKKINGDYHVDVIDGYVPNDLIEEFAQMHISRWRFAGSNSPFFSNPKRKDEYRVHPDNKHFLRIYAGDELLACHYGMKYGKSLLFHTPIINPKYLNLSPMKLILAETAKYCEVNGIDLIDFGHGDEAYKDGYCTLPRHTCNFEKAVTFRGYVAELIGKIQKYKLYRKFKNLKYHSQTEIKMPELRTKDDLTAVNAKIISKWTDFCDFSKEYGLPIYKWQYEIFKNKRGINFVAIIKDGNCIDSYWKDGETID